MNDKIKFLDKEYDEASLKSESIEDLVTLRNLIATNLGVATVKAFKDHETAIVQTWKALQKFDETVKAEAGGAEPKAVKAPKEPKDRKQAKPAGSQYVKRPTRKMFSVVNIVKQHTGAEGRAHRWPAYKDGMLVIDAIEGEGTLAWDIMNWEIQGLMTVTEPTDAEYAERRAAWYKKHGLEDPDLSKSKKDEEREVAKANREKAVAAKKAEREVAKAAKAEAAVKAKAEKETAKVANTFTQAAE